MATVEEEFANLQTSTNRPIPGESLFNDPEKPWPWERPPKFTSVHEATEYLWESFIEPDTYTNLMQTVADGVPIMDITQIILFTEFQKGSWNPDLMIMLFEPTAYMIMALAENIGLEMAIYEGEEEDDELEDSLSSTGLEESKIQKIIKDSKQGKIPEGVLTAEMQKSLESLPDLNIDAESVEVEEPSLLEASEVEEQPDSLMARPTGV